MGARQVDEETIRRWISENSSSPSTTSNTFYTSLLLQSGSSLPTESVVSTDVTPAPTLARVQAGVYNLHSTAFIAGKIITPFGNFNGDAALFLPIIDTSAVIGYYTYYDNGGGGFVTINVYNAAFVLVDWSTLAGASAMPIDIKLLP